MAEITYEKRGDRDSPKTEDILHVRRGVVLFPSSRPTAPLQLHRTPAVGEGGETLHWTTLFGKGRRAWL